MPTDDQGLGLTGSVESAAHFDRAIGHLVRFQIDVVREASAAADEGTCALGSVFRAYLSLMSTEGSAADDAHATLGKVDRSGDLLPRELGHLAAVDRWLGGDLLGAASVLNDLSIEFPRDVLALVVGHQLDFLTGEAPRLRDRIAQAIGSWSPDDRLFGFLQGMLAFGLEECNLYGMAEEAAASAVAANPDDVWGIHAMVHTFEMQGRVGEGVRFLRAREGEWSTGNFLNVHNSWHLALFLLEADDVVGALDLHDRVLRHDPTRDVAFELVDAASLLWRLRLDGIDVGDRWRAVADAWGRVLEPGYYSFNDAHATMAFVGADELDRARDLVDALEASARTGAPASSSHGVTVEVGLPVCRGLLRFAEARYDDALDELLAVRSRLHEFGGSHAQRDVVHRTILEASLRAERLDLARALVSERLAVRDASAYGWAKRAALLGAADDPAGAERARDRASALAAASA